MKMMCTVFGILLIQTTIINAMACLEPKAATVHIQNYDGPIYVTPCDNRPPTCNPSPTCNNRCPTLTNPSSICDNRCPTLTNPSSICDNRYPTLTNLPSICDNQSPILHSSAVPYHQTICETDCKCITKQACVPVNPVLQNPCTPNYYCSVYPEGCYGYVYPEGQTYCPETDLPCPRLSETLIPLLKTYLSQSSQGTGKCPKHSCQCGNNHSQYYC